MALTLAEGSLGDAAVEALCPGLRASCSLRRLELGGLTLSQPAAAHLASALAGAPACVNTLCNVSEGLRPQEHPAAFLCAPVVLRWHCWLRAPGWLVLLRWSTAMCTRS